MCSKRSVLDAYELLFLSFFQIFWSRATQSWPKPPFSKMGFDIFLTFFEFFYFIFGKPKPSSRGQCLAFFRSIKIKGSADRIFIRCFANFGIFKNQFSKKNARIRKLPIFNFVKLYWAIRYQFASIRNKFKSAYNSLTEISNLEYRRFRSDFGLQTKFFRLRR